MPLRLASSCRHDVNLNLALANWNPRHSDCFIDPVDLSTVPTTIIYEECFTMSKSKSLTIGAMTLAAAIGMAYAQTGSQSGTSGSSTSPGASSTGAGTSGSSTTGSGAAGTSRGTTGGATGSGATG